MIRNSIADIDEGRERGAGRLLASMKTLMVITPRILYQPPSRTLKSEAEADEDGVVMCSGPEEEEEVGWAEWSRAGGMGEARSV